MKVLTARWVAGSVAAVSVALTIGTLVLSYADRYLVPVGRSGWDLSNVFGHVTNLAVPATGFVIASPLSTPPWSSA